MEPFIRTLTGTEESIAFRMDKILHESGFELIDLYVAESGNKRFLRLYVDTLNPNTYISLDQITTVNHLVPQDLINKWAIEVTSPGIDRPLARKSHFQQAKGKEIKVEVCTASGHFKPRTYQAKLLELNDASITLKLKKENFDICWDVITKANIVFKF
jgi:ribosome maturation factor RimP